MHVPIPEESGADALLDVRTPIAAAPAEDHRDVGWHELAPRECRLILAGMSWWR